MSNGQQGATQQGDNETECNKLVSIVKKTSLPSESSPQNTQAANEQQAAANLQQFENIENTKQRGTAPARQQRAAAKAAKQQVRLHLMATRFFK